MDDRRFGRLIRSLRLHRGWRQLDVEHAAGIDQTTQSLIEVGKLAGLTVEIIRRSASALGADVQLQLRVPVALTRLADAAHARLVEAVVLELRRNGWEVVTELTFNSYGERGSVDVVAWHAGRRTLLLIEVKTRLVDEQELLAAIDRKCRIVPAMVRRDRGWDAQVIGRLLLVEEGTTQRRVVHQHRETFAVAFPDRTVRVKAWVRDPVGPLAGLWFLSSTTANRGKQDFAALRRVRKRRPRSRES